MKRTKDRSHTFKFTKTNIDKLNPSKPTKYYDLTTQSLGLYAYRKKTYFLNASIPTVKAGADQMQKYTMMMFSNIQLMQNNILEAQKTNQTLYKNNKEPAKQNEEFLKYRNDVIRKYNLYIEFQKIIPP